MTNQTVLFDTRDFELAHGKRPRGFGSWAFSFDGRFVGVADPRVLWTSGMTFAQARKLARAEAKVRGASTVWVLS